MGGWVGGWLGGGDALSTDPRLTPSGRLVRYKIDANNTDKVIAYFVNSLCLFVYIYFVFHSLVY